MILEGKLNDYEFAALSAAVYGELDEIARRAEAAPLPKKEVDLSSVYATEAAHG
jgi:hypothetical protein